MKTPTPKQDDRRRPARENPPIKPLPAETMLYVAHWAEIQKEMNRILALEED